MTYVLGDPEKVEKVYQTATHLQRNHGRKDQVRQIQKIKTFF